MKEYVIKLFKIVFKYKLIIIILMLYYILSNFLFGYTCPSMIFFGYPCPGCGLTRSGILLLRGDLHGSFQMNPMLIPTMTMICIFFLNIKKQSRVYYSLFYFIACSDIIVFALRMRMYFPNIEPLVRNHNSMLDLVIRGTKILMGVIK